MSDQPVPRPERPAQRVRELPEWPHPDAEPELPEITVQQLGPDRWQVQLTLRDEVQARWLAHWLARRPVASRGNFWEAYGEWLDGHRG